MPKVCGLSMIKTAVICSRTENRSQTATQTNALNTTSCENFRSKLCLPSLVMFRIISSHLISVSGSSWQIFTCCCFIISRLKDKIRCERDALSLQVTFKVWLERWEPLATPKTERHKVRTGRWEVPGYNQSPHVWRTGGSHSNTCGCRFYTKHLFLQDHTEMTAWSQALANECQRASHNWNGIKNSQRHVS